MTMTARRRARALAATSTIALAAMSGAWALASAANAAPGEAADTPAAAADEAQAKGEDTPDFGTRVNELVVKGSRPAAVAPSTASLEATEPQSIISPSAIDQFVPSTADYSQIALIAPSVSGLAQNGPGLSENKTVLRGFQDGQYNVTYDGIPFGDANGPTHHTTSYFPASTIGAVVIDRGPGEAADLGTANFGGSINLFSPEVTHEHSGMQEVTYGSWGTGMSETKIQTGDLDQMHGLRVLFNFQELTTSGNLRLNSATDLNQLMRAVLPINDHWDLTFFTTLNETKTHVNDNAGATHDGASHDQIAQYGKNFGLNNDPTSPNYWKYNLVDKHTDFEYIRLNGDVGTALHVEDTVYTYHYLNVTNSTLDPTLSPAEVAAQTVILTPNGTAVPGLQAYTKINDYRIMGNTLHTNWTVPFGEIRAGVWFEHADIGPRSRFDYVATTGAPDYINLPGPGILPTTPQNEEYRQFGRWNQVQPFVDVVWNVTPRLTITPSVKYIDFDLSIDTAANQKTRQPDHESKTFTHTLEFLTANYKLSDDWSAYAQYATAFLVPDISIFQVPGPDVAPLKPQTTTNYQIGTVFHRGKLAFDADLYYITFKNMLQTDTVGQETIYENVGGAVYKGVEGEVSYLLTDNLSAFANGSYNYAVSTTGTFPGLTAAPTNGFAVKSAPRDTAAIGLLYRSQDWTASISDKYVGVSWADNYQSDNYKVPGYNQTDLKVTRTFGGVRLEASIFNLLDSQALTSIKPNKQSKKGHNNQSDTAAKNMPYDQYFYQPGRSFQVGLRVNF